MITYDKIEDLGMAVDMQSWPSHASPVFAELIHELKPKTIIEVGSWKGASACVMAKLGEPYGTKVLCVDHFCGDALHAIKGPQIPRDQWGYSRLFHQFLTNIKSQGLQDKIVPYPMDSTAGAVYLQHLKITAKLIYVDGDHTMHGCYNDIVNYWELLEPGGVMFIDDVLVFPEIFAATIRFCCERGIDMKTTPPFALLRKIAS